MTKLAKSAKSSAIAKAARVEEINKMQWFLIDHGFIPGQAIVLYDEFGIDSSTLEKCSIIENGIMLYQGHPRHDQNDYIGNEQKVILGRLRGGAFSDDGMVGKAYFGIMRIV